MKEIKKEVITEQTIYEITKEELDKIKKDKRIEGIQDISNYVLFSLKNYKYKLNITGVYDLIVAIIDFLDNKTNIIENTYGYSFEDFCKYKQ